MGAKCSANAFVRAEIMSIFFIPIIFCSSYGREGIE